MAVVKNLMVRSGADFSALYREMNKAQKRLSTFQKGINKAMKVIGITLGSLAVGKLIKDSISAAMNVENSMLQIQRTMGDSANAFNEWAQTQAKAYGMAREEAFKYGATYSNLISSFVRDTQETARYTTELLKASAVVASATGRTMEDTMERIRSGLLGNTEAIEDLGIHVNVAMLESTEAFRQFARGRSWQQLTFQEQQQIRLLSILEQANLKYGDSLAGTTQTRQLIFLATLKNIRLNLGQAFLPIYNTILPLLTALASKIEYVTGILAQFMQALFGTKQAQQQVKVTQAQAGAMKELGDATEKAGKKAKGALAGFDELNTLMIDTGGAAGGVATGEGAVGTQIIEEDDGASGAIGEIANKATEMATKVRETFTNMKNAIVENKDIIVTSVGAIGGAFAAVFIYKNWPSAIGAVTAALTDLGLKAKAALAFLVANPVWLLVAAIGALIGVLVTAYLTNDEFRAKVDALWNRIKTALTPALQKLGEILSWVWQNIMIPVGQFLAEVFATAWQVLGDILNWLWENILIPLGDFLLWLWDSVLVPLASIITEVLGLAFQTLIDLAKKLWENVLVPLGDFLLTIFVEIIKSVTDIFINWWETALKPIAAFLTEVFKVAVEVVIAVFEFLWKNVLEPLISYMSGAFMSAFNTVTEGVKTAIYGLKTTFQGLINFITGIFTGDWKRAWEGVRDIFKGIFDTLYGFVKVPLNLIIDAINTVIGGLNKLSIKIPDWVPGLGGKSWGINIPKIPRLAKGGLAYGPTLAVIGDNPRVAADPEVISPLSKLQDIMGGSNQAVVEVLNRILRVIESNSGDIVLKMNENELGRATIKALNAYQRATGKSLVLLLNL